ncbi:TonB-dependent copper receptor [Pectobacterium polonicum]|uniref:TonB-dependent copper receptor n=1 Tax=Pectobacterium polonicum TaxID=2485124 RepID=A0ABV1P740_9GAMM|nr:TonB-dependent copper receptor [Pectobacterium polonicum]MDC9819407.1 TonB-dependent copper receptor [Pectobacterium polonicum]
MKKIELVYTPAASLVLVALASLPVMALGEHDHSATHATLNDDAVMVVTAPETSPLTLVTSPKTPRQPVPASDGSDYLKTIPGFSQIRNGGTNGDPVFRGMFGSRLRLLSNNGEMLGACPSRMDAPSSYISPESYDQLTFTKGPQTVLWGAGNSAGTVRFERTPPRFEKPGIQGSASVLTASNDHHDENADVSFGSEEGYFRLIGNKSQSGDYKDGEGKRVASKWDKWNADVALGWTPDSDTLLELTAGKGDGEARYAGRGMDGSQFKRESVGIRAEKSNIGNVLDKLEASAYYNYADHVMDNYTLRSPSGMGMMGMPMASQLDRKTVGGRMMATWIWADYELKSGADMQTNTHRRWRNDGWKKDAQFNTYGVFSELTWQASEQSKVIGGTRLDQTKVENNAGTSMSERHDTLPAGFIRVEHTLADTPIMLYAGIGYTERFPDYWELFSPTYGPGRTQSAFDHVKTEKTTQLDIGAQYSGQRLNSWVSAYMGRVNDFILFRYDPMNARVSEADNINATIMGGETGFSYKLTDSWKTDASLAYSWAKNTDDHRPLPQIPPLEARLGLSWEKGNWSSTGLLRLVSQQNRVALNEGNVVGKDFDHSSGFAIFSANAVYRVNQYVKLSTGVDNLFNTTYSEHLNLAGNSSFGYSANSSVNEPGRTYWAKVNIIF